MGRRWRPPRRALISNAMGDVQRTWCLGFALACVAGCGKSDSASSPGGAPLVDDVIFAAHGQYRPYDTGPAPKGPSPVLAIVAGGGRLLFTRNDGIEEVESGRHTEEGGEVTRFTGETPYSLGATPDRAVFGTLSSMVSLPFADGPVTTLAGVGADRIALDGTTAYSIAWGGNMTGQLLVQKTVVGAAPVTIATLAGTLNVLELPLAQDDAALYIATRNGTYRVAKSDGAQTKLTADECNWVLVDDTFYYLGECFAPGSTGPAELRRIPKAGGAATVAPGVDSFQAFVVKGIVYMLEVQDTSTDGHAHVLRVDFDAVTTTDLANADASLDAIGHDDAWIYYAGDYCTCLENHGPNKGGMPGGGACSLEDCTTKIRRVALH
jgi:hypothetical protein